MTADARARLREKATKALEGWTRPRDWDACVRVTHDGDYQPALGAEYMNREAAKPDAAYIAAASPDAILALLDESAALRQMLGTLADAMGGWHSMTPHPLGSHGADESCQWCALVIKARALLSTP